MLNLVGVIFAFILVIILIRKKFNFGLSLLFGSLIVALFSIIDVNAIEIPKGLAKALIYDVDKQIFDFQTMELVILLTLIYILAEAMRQTGAIDKMVKSLRSIFNKGGTLGVIPAVYGLMPVPGGALFSAPLIDKEGKKYNLSQNQKNFLNVWFRHIWFPIFPVSSAMILIVSSEFADIDIYEIILANIPAFFAFIIIGLIFLKFFINKTPKPKNNPKKEYKGLIFLLPPLAPIIYYIGFFCVLFIFGLGDVLKIFQRTIFIGGVLIGIILLCYLINFDGKKYIEILKNSIKFHLALAIIGIMIFRQMIEVSGANDEIASLIFGLPFHAIFIVILIPLIMGLITGYNFGAIALSYFLVEPFFEFTNLNIVGIASLIFISSLVGYLISPIHLCNVVSSDYLKTDSTRMYKMYIPASIMLLAVHTAFIIIFYR